MPAASLSLEVVVLSITDILNSPLNPRANSPWQFSDKALRPLADAMAAATNLELITVRPHPTLPGKYELANGERRWRAAPLAGVATLQAIVKQLSDAEMLDIMLGGGANQEPLSPMAEAHGYKERMALDGLTQSGLARQLGIDEKSVRRRLVLLELPSEGQKAVDEGRLDPSTAYLIATLPGAAERMAFASDVMHPEMQDQPLSRRAAEALREAKYCRSLRGVPFDTKDALLVPTAGSCTHCKFNEGSQCANIACFESKVVAARDRVTGEYRKRGVEPLTAEENTKAFPHGEDGLSYKVDFVEYAKPVPEHLVKAEVTPPKWADICHGPKARLQVRVGFDQAGRPVELVKVGEAVCAADLNEQQIFNEETRVRFGLENQTPRSVAGRKSTVESREPDPEDSELIDVDPPSRITTVAAAATVKDRALEWIRTLLFAHGPALPHEFRTPGWHIIRDAGLIPADAEVCEGCDKYLPTGAEAHDKEGLAFCPDCEAAADVEYKAQLAQWVKAHSMGMAVEEIARSYDADIEDVCGALGVPMPEVVT